MHFELVTATSGAVDQIQTAVLDAASSKIHLCLGLKTPWA